jgi:hypothetical protein
MAETDVESSVAGGTHTDQKRYGTHNEQFARLSESFHELMKEGAADEKWFKTLCFTLLSGFEGVRTDQEAQIKQYEAKIAYCRARQESASMFANMLLGMVATQVQEAKTANVPEPIAAPGELADGTKVMTAEEVRQKYCICACQDDEDAENCECSCHKGVPCDDERCIVCQAKKVQVKAETSGRRRRTPATKPSKKKARRKTSRAKKE